MNLTEVKKSLERQFERELSQGSKRNIVFWYDDEGVFADSINSLELVMSEEDLDVNPDICIIHYSVFIIQYSLQYEYESMV